MGQALLPEHFYAQEHSLREELSTRLELSAVPAWASATCASMAFSSSKAW